MDQEVQEVSEAQVDLEDLEDQVDQVDIMVEVDTMEDQAVIVWCAECQAGARLDVAICAALIGHTVMKPGQ